MKALSHQIPAVLLAGALVFLALVLAYKNSDPSLASVQRGGEYQATSTQSTAGTFPSEYNLQSGFGTLGSVTITGATTGTINLYDATTSSALLRTPPVATSSLLLASFPASTAAGTYTFDRVFFNGLYIVVTGITPTTTITFRQ